MCNLLVSNRRFTLLICVFLAGFLAVAVRLAWFQIYDSEKYVQEAKSKMRSRNIDVASRGQITDCRGEVLARNRECWDIGVDLKELAEGDVELIPKIAEILELPEDFVRRKYATKDSRWVVLKKDVSSEVRQAIWDLQPRRVRALNGEFKGQLITRNFFKPVYGVKKSVRDYPRGELASQLIGYLNKEGVPVMGIEKTMNDFLCGENGWAEITHDRKGQELVYRRSRDIPARDGNTVELTIDARIQKFAEEQCRKIAEEYTPISSCIIVSEAGSGRLLALANWPTFDLNEFSDPQKAPLENQRNRAVTDVYDPGSVFKTFIAAMALEKKLITPNSRFDCTLTKVPYFGRMSYALPKDDHPIGDSEPLRRVMVKSSNRGFAQIGMRFIEKFGKKAFYDNIRKFGFGSRTNLLSVVGERGESVGYVKSPEKIDRSDATRIPIGHSVSVTPLQIHNAMSVIASRGRFWEPLLVNRVLDERGNTLFEYSPRSRGQVVSPKVAAIIADMLKDVCSAAAGGTASRAEVKGYEVAGKTGTSRKYINGIPSPKNHIGTFSGFFPASNPKIVITVVVDDPKPEGIGYGGRVSAPVFKKIVEEIAEYLEIPKVEKGETAR